MLVRLNVDFPLFCISLVSAPAKVTCQNPSCGPILYRYLINLSITRLAGTSKYDQAEAPLSVPQGASSEQHLVVVQGVGLSIKSQRSLKLVQAVVGSLTPHFT